MTKEEIIAQIAASKANGAVADKIRVAAGLTQQRK